VKLSLVIPFRAEVAKRIVIEENRFGVEPELTAKVTKYGVRRA
jgi:hypothetical protein